METENETRKEDLSLKNLNQFYGTEYYHNVMGTRVTDGVAYVMVNGYSWFVTDFLALILINHNGLKNQEFLSIKLKLDGSKAKMIVTDGNEKILYTQDYDYTNAQRELQFYLTDNVMMLTSEY